MTRTPFISVILEVLDRRRWLCQEHFLGYSNIKKALQKIPDPDETPPPKTTTSVRVGILCRVKLPWSPCGSVWARKSCIYFRVRALYLKVNFQQPNYSKHLWWQEQVGHVRIAKAEKSLEGSRRQTTGAQFKQSVEIWRQKDRHHCRYKQKGMVLWQRCLRNFWVQEC